MESATLHVNEGIQCPNCRSTQLFGKRKQAGWKRMVDDVIFTDGIDTLGLVYRSRGIVVQCQSCKYEWDPWKRVGEERFRIHQQKTANEKQWKSAFYNAVEQGNRTEAERILKQEREHLYRRMDIFGAYDILKKEDHSTRLFLFVLFAICISLLSGIFLCFVE